ncbi:MAG: hypothetical protein Q4C47_08040 [Planctomycetia bacterium]|nr:hypothetical protein [Planctomycetia bacterium]
MGAALPIFAVLTATGKSLWWALPRRQNYLVRVGAALPTLTHGR